MTEYLLTGFIVIGLLISLIGTILWYKMVKKNRPLPELVKKLRKEDEDDNIPTPPMGMG